MRESAGRLRSAPQFWGFISLGASHLLGPAGRKALNGWERCSSDGGCLGRPCTRLRVSESSHGIEASSG